MDASQRKAFAEAIENRMSEVFGKFYIVAVYRETDAVSGATMIDVEDFIPNGPAEKMKRWCALFNDCAFPVLIKSFSGENEVRGEVDPETGLLLVPDDDEEATMYGIVKKSDTAQT